MSTPARSTCSRTSSAAPPSATTSWSKPQARAQSSTWPSSVPSRYGSSCFGWPRRLEPPAATTSPVVNRLIGDDMTRLVRAAAPLAAEPDRAAVADERRRRWRCRDLHAADRVDRGDGQLRLLATARSHDLGEDRQRDLLRT